MSPQTIDTTTPLRSDDGRNSRGMAKRTSHREMFEKTLLPYESALYGTALALTRSASDAEDLVQDTMLRAYDRFDTFRADSGSPLAWLQAILRNLYFSGVRKKSHPSRTVSLDRFDPAIHALTDKGGGPALPVAAHAAAANSTEQQALARMEADAVLSAIRALPSDCRRIVFLSDVEGHSYREMAALLGIPEGTVRSRLSRGRARVRRALFGWQADETRNAEGRVTNAYAATFTLGAAV